MVGTEGFGRQRPRGPRAADSTMSQIRTQRLTDGDREVARSLFALMANVFEEASAPLSDSYLDRLLRRDAFWAVAAFVGDELVGGLTAHLLPMTRAEASELFLYDLAVRADWQRHGIGRCLVTALREQAVVAGIQTVFVPADNDDLHALDFYQVLGGVPSAVTFFTFSDDRDQ
jgi:aminoglycoside 3-N-acetyltransferase I